MSDLLPISEKLNQDDPTTIEIGSKDGSTFLTSPPSGELLHGSHPLSPPPYDVKSGEPIPVVRHLTRYFPKQLSYLIIIII